MTITRKQLELAARAAEIELYWQRYYAEDGPTPYVGTVQWSPLTDHGQLHDLAMACGICIDPRDNSIEYKVTPKDAYSTGEYVDCQDFPSLAEAVILAASEQQLAKENVE